MSAGSALLRCDCQDHPRSLDALQQKQLGDLFASFLPGLSTTLTRVITGDFKQGHSIVVSSLQGLLQDSEFHYGSQPARKGLQRSGEACRGSMSMTDGSQEASWVKSTGDKLTILIKR